MTDLDDRVDAWHESGPDETRPLHEYLGMSREQYAHWATTGAATAGRNTNHQTEGTAMTNTTTTTMYERLYFEIQTVLDEALGGEVEDGAGEGIVADVRLAIQRAEEKGRKAGREAAARDIEATGNYERQARIAREGLNDDDRRRAAESARITEAGAR